MWLNLASVLLYVWGWWHWTPDLLTSTSQSWDYWCVFYHPWSEMHSDFGQRGLCYGIIYSVMEEWMRKHSLNFLFSFLLSLSLDSAHGPLWMTTHWIYPFVLSLSWRHPEGTASDALTDPHVVVWGKDWALVWKNLIYCLILMSSFSTFSNCIGVLVP